MTMYEHIKSYLYINDYYIVDGNIVFSTIISGKESKAFRLPTIYDFELFISEEILFEFRKHA